MVSGIANYQICITTTMQVVRRLNEQNGYIIEDRDKEIRLVLL